MKDKNCPRTGIIYCKDKQNFNFYLNDYTATFMEPNHSEIHLDGNFLFGQTSGYNSIAIFKGDSIPSFSGSTALNTSAYLVAVENGLGTNWDSFDFIEFTGGILNSLFLCDALKCEDMENGDILVHRQNTHKRWKFEIEDGCECELVIGSWIKQNFGLTGVSLTNNIVDLRLKFSRPQALEASFKFIWKVKTVLSIMVGRANVTFDEIYLRHNNPQLSKMQLFLKNETQPVSKEMMKCITFHDLDEATPNLFNVIFNSKDAAPSYEIGFLPNSAKDFSLITNEKVRLICSSLECELSFCKDQKQSEEENLQQLIQSVKSLIKAHRKGSERLSDKTYDLIYNSIKHWTMSASDRICALYHQYDTEMNILNQTAMSLSDEDIKFFVKYRNDITHGSYRVMNQKIALTAYLLQGLVYCCFLTRIGISRDQVTLLCHNKKILS